MRNGVERECGRVKITINPSRHSTIEAIPMMLTSDQQENLIEDDERYEAQLDV